MLVSSILSSLLVLGGLAWWARESLSSPEDSLYVSSLRFKIAVFADLHHGEDEDSFGIPQDINSTQLMGYVLEVERPDLAVLNGDLITGENTFAFNSTDYIHRIVAPLEARSIPWASTYGNHDSKYNLSRDHLLEAERTHPLSHTHHGPVRETDGVTNYALHLRVAGDATPLAHLWFFDSRGGSQGDASNEDNIPNYVSARTAAWFQRTSARWRRRWRTIPSLAFVHIPVRAYLDLQASAEANVSGPHHPGMNADVPLAVQGDGGGEDESFARALLDTPGLHSVYAGHDHGDAWCGRWPGDATSKQGQGPRPFLCFCKHSGFGGYGTWNRGVRIVQLEWDVVGRMRVETWVRMQTGEVVTAVALNETYGQDVYPVADGGYHPYHGG